jgi:hypothetical protein
MIEINELKIGNKIELIVANIEVINKHFFRPIFVARYGPIYEPEQKEEYKNNKKGKNQYIMIDSSNSNLSICV